MSDAQHHIDVHGDRFPALGLGTWRLRDEECTDVVRAALRMGYRHIDTAQFYDNEAAIGQALADGIVPRESVFLTTKLWRENLHAPAVQRTTEESLARLGCDYVDLLLIHWPSQTVPIQETMAAMNRLVEQGKVRHIGLSNFSTALMAEAQRASSVPIFANQVEYHPYLSQEKVLAFCRQNGVALTAYCPLARCKILDEPVLVEIGRKHGKTPTQVTLRWFMQQEIVAAIPKASSEAHLRSNLDIWDFALTDEDMRAVFALARPDGRMIDFDFSPEWD